MKGHHMKLLDPEKLKVYDTALEFVVAAEQIAAATPRGHADLADQLRRASTSIVLNIAEGAGEFAPREKTRFYRLARRSATECAAVVEIYNRLHFVEPGVAANARAKLVEIVSMLVGMITHAESRGAAGSKGKVSGGQRQGQRQRQVAELSG